MGPRQPIRLGLFLLWTPRIVVAAQCLVSKKNELSSAAS